MNMIRRVILMLALALAVPGLWGCGAIVRSAIDTQPRVDIDAAALATPDEIVHGHAAVYQVQSTAPDCDEDLAKYAPLIVQGFQPDADNAAYDYWSDGLGTPIVAADGETVRVDTEHPVVFARVEWAQLYGVSLKQLTFVYWYPRRDIGSIEAGEVDGGILRLTLDAAGHPAIFEFSQTCGCYHGVFAAARTESQAQEEFGTAQEPRKHSLEAPAHSSEWIIREVIEVEDGQKPVLYLSAGDHFCEVLRFVDPGAQLNTHEQRGYALEPYDRLDALHSDAGGTMSMFNDKRLVRGAKRWKEELVFGGLDHPGWPRHLDVMLVHWDHDRWNDPRLLERNLQMPHAAAQHSSVDQIAQFPTNAHHQEHNR